VAVVLALQQRFCVCNTRRED